LNSHRNLHHTINSASGLWYLDIIQVTYKPKSSHQIHTNTKMSLPATYKRAVFLGKGEPLTIEDVPMISAAKGQVLVKVEACGVCFSDLYAQMGATL